MKQYRTLLLLSFLCLTACGKTPEPSSTATSPSLEPTTSISSSPASDPLYRNTDHSVLSDPKWTQGFVLKSTRTTDAHVVGNLDYNKTTEREPFWQMAQWWTPDEYDFINSKYSLLSSGVHQYENESRKAVIDTNEGSFKMSLNSTEEYLKNYGTKERPSDKSWSHFLLEQSFDESQCFYMNQFEKLVVSFDFSIDECTYLGDKEDSKNEAAQFLLYLRLFNRPAEDADEKEVGKKNANIWFGLPLFDSRYDFVDEYKQGDVGFVGATGSLIYSIAGTEFLSEKIQYTKTYHVEIDVLEYIKDAVIYGVMNDYLTNCKWNNMMLRYLNVGWELPGSFSASATLSHLDVTYELA